MNAANPAAPGLLPPLILPPKNSSRETKSETASNVVAAVTSHLSRYLARSILPVSDSEHPRNQKTGCTKRARFVDNI